MNNDELQNLTETISKQYFNKIFEHEAYFNNRLRMTGGRYILKTHNIELNPMQYKHYGLKALKDIIKHELCHYHLHLSGKGYQHKDNDFKELSAKVGAPRFCSAIKSYQERANYEYQCKRCGVTYLRIKRVNISIMRCGKCNGKLKLNQDYRK